jgi:hypothetical protein
VSDTKVCVDYRHNHSRQSAYVQSNHHRLETHYLP